MAIIKRNELKGMNEQQLHEKLIDLKKEMLKINGQIAMKTTPENPGRVREVKKTIARLYTFLHQKKHQVKAQPVKTHVQKTTLKKEAPKQSKQTSGGKTKKL